MHAMSHRSDFYVTCHSEVNIYNAALFLTIRYLLMVKQAELPSAQYPTAMSDTKTLITLLLVVIISYKKKHICIRDLSDRILQIIFHAYWASMSVGRMWPIVRNNSILASSWRFYLHSGIESTGCPAMIRIVCHQVLRHPSEHETSSMGKHWLAKAQIAKLHKLKMSEVTELTSLTVDETAFAILKTKGSRGILTVTLLTKLKFND
jgi:hypothetical protein